MQLIEVELAEVVDALAGDREQEPRRPQSRALAVGTGVLDHDLIEPRFHPRASLATLPVATIVSLDSPRDPMEADLAPLPLASRILRIRRTHDRDLLRLEPEEDRLPRRIAQ